MFVLEPLSFEKFWLLVSIRMERKMNIVCCTYFTLYKHKNKNETAILFWTSFVVAHPFQKSRLRHRFLLIETHYYADAQRVVAGGELTLCSRRHRPGGRRGSPAGNGRAPTQRP